MSQAEIAHPTGRPAQSRIAGVIRALMASRQEGQADLARLLHVEQSTISKMLTGSRKMTVDELDLIADYYGQDPTVFFRGVDELFRGRSREPQNAKFVNPTGLTALPGGRSGGASVQPGTRRDLHLVGPD